MILLSSTILIINGHETNVFDTIDLEQEIDNHHILTAVFRMDVLENDPSKEFGNKSQELLGKSIAVQVKSSVGSDTEHTLEFNGVITKVIIKKGSNGGLGDQVFVTGKSPTIFADDGPHLDSYENRTLQELVTNSLNFYNISNNVLPLHTGNILYSVQNNESGFEYVSRLSKQYGEWFYYNGDKVIFGKPEDNVVILKYHFDLHEFEVELNPLPNNFTYLSNDYINDELLDAKGADNANDNQFRSSVVESAENLYPNDSQVFANQNNSESADAQLKASADAQQAAREVNQIKLKGSSTNPGVHLGNIVEVEANRYRITKITHTTNRNNFYKNEFEAVPENPKGYPLTAINAYPKSASQVAIVMENNDPQGLGRVRVQFPWQKKQNKMTPWVRVVALQAGKSGGMFRIPHKGDEVIVDFENGNAEIPYTSGSLYNKNAKPPEGSASKSNHFTVWKVGPLSITLDEGKGSICMKDKSGSSICLDGEGNINITASKGEVAIKGPQEVSLISDDEVSLNGKKEVSLMSDNEVSLKGNIEVSIESASEVNVKGLRTTVTGDAEATLEGTMIKINGTAITSIKGGMVKMN